MRNQLLVVFADFGENFLGAVGKDSNKIVIPQSFRLRRPENSLGKLGFKGNCEKSAASVQIQKNV